MFVTLTHWGLAKTYISNIEKILSRCYSRAECLHDNEELLELNHDVIEAMNKKTSPNRNRIKKKNDDNDDNIKNNNNSSSNSNNNNDNDNDNEISNIDQDELNDDEIDEYDDSDYDDDDDDDDDDDADNGGAELNKLLQFYKDALSLNHPSEEKKNETDIEQNNNHNTDNNQNNQNIQNNQQNQHNETVNSSLMNHYL